MGRYYRIQIRKQVWESESRRWIQKKMNRVVDQDTLDRLIRNEQTKESEGKVVSIKSATETEYLAERRRNDRKQTEETKMLS